MARRPPASNLHRRSAPTWQPLARRLGAEPTGGFAVVHMADARADPSEPVIADWRFGEILALRLSRPAPFLCAGGGPREDRRASTPTARMPAPSSSPSRSDLAIRRAAPGGRGGVLKPGEGRQQRWRLWFTVLSEHTGPVGCSRTEGIDARLPSAIAAPKSLPARNRPNSSDSCPSLPGYSSSSRRHRAGHRRIASGSRLSRMRIGCRTPPHRWRWLRRATLAPALRECSLRGLSCASGLYPQPLRHVGRCSSFIRPRVRSVAHRHH